MLGDAEAAIGVLMSRLGRLADRNARDVLAAHRLSPRQLRVLDLLADRGPTGQRELGGLIGVDHSTLVHLLNPLESDGFLVRERDQEDRRRHVVSITAAGSEHLAEADCAFRRAEDELVAALDPAQREQLRQLLRSLQVAHFADEPELPCDGLGD